MRCRTYLRMKKMPGLQEWESVVSSQELYWEENAAVMELSISITNDWTLEYCKTRGYVCQTENIHILFWFQGLFFHAVLIVGTRWVPNGAADTNNHRYRQPVDQRHHGEEKEEPIMHRHCCRHHYHFEQCHQGKDDKICSSGDGLAEDGTSGRKYAYERCCCGEQLQTLLLNSSKYVCSYGKSEGTIEKCNLISTFNRDELCRGIHLLEHGETYQDRARRSNSGIHLKV